MPITHDRQISVMVDPEDANRVTELGDGFAEVDLSEDEEYLEDSVMSFTEGHFENLVPFLEEDFLEELGHTVVDLTKDDENTRREYLEDLSLGFKNLGLRLNDTDEPFPGACTAEHPIILETAIKFQSKAIQELFPANGPVKTQVLGDVTTKREAKASRVRNFMNYQVTTVMPEYFTELEQMTLYLPLQGSGIRKIWYNIEENRPEVSYVKLEDFVIDLNECSDLAKARRYTHKIFRTHEEFKADIINGLYVALETCTPTQREKGVLETSVDEENGIADNQAPQELTHELLEQHTYLTLPDPFGDDDGLARPYIVTVDKASRQVLSIRRNWSEDDVNKRKLEWFVHYQYIPGFGFYGLGLVSLLGNFQKTLTSVMRSLVDAGQFANLQGGFKTKNLRISGSSEPLAPGEWRDVEVASGKLSDAFFIPPYKEPSSVLAQFYGVIEARSQNFADTAERIIADSANYGPVGTTAALLEAGTKMFSAQHKRLHNAQKREFQILKRLNKDFLPEVYPYDVVGGSREIFAEDFDNEVDIVPVSDPNVSSNAHRMALAQAKLQMLQQDKTGVINSIEIYKDFLGAMGVEDTSKYLAEPEQAQPLDPLSDIMAANQGKAISAFPGQDHEAHMQFKMAWMQDPNGGAGPLFAHILPVIQANIREHSLMMFQEQLGGMVQASGVASDEASQEKVMAEAAQKISQTNQMLAAQNAGTNAEQMLAEAEILKAQAMAEDTQNRHAREEAKIGLEAQKLALDMLKEANDVELARAKLESDVGVNLAKIEAKQAEKQFETGAQFVKEAFGKLD